MRGIAYIAVVISAFIGFSLLDVLKARSPEVAAQKAEAAKVLADGIPALATLGLPLDDCTFLSKESITAFNCKFFAAFNPLNADKPAPGWKLVAPYMGEDSWRREAIVYSYRSSLWTAEVYLSNLNTISGVSLVRYGPWPY